MVIRWVGTIIIVIIAVMIALLGKSWMFMVTLLNLLLITITKVIIIFFKMKIELNI